MTAQRRAEGLLLAATVIWGSTFVITKGLLEVATPLVYTAIRYLLAALLVALLFARRIRAIRSEALLPGAVLGFLLFSGFAFQTVGLQYTTASKSAFFTGTMVVFTPMFHVAARRWFPAPGKVLLAGNLLGVLLSAAGLWLMTSPEGGGFNQGDAMTIVSAVLFAVYIVYLDSLRNRIEAMGLTFVMFLSCGILGMITTFLWEDVRIDPGPGFYIPLAYLVVFATVIASGVQNRFQADTTPTRAAVIFSFEPVLAALFAYIFRGEMIGAAGIAGGAIIFMGLILSELSDAIPVLRHPLGGLTDASAPPAG